MFVLTAHDVFQKGHDDDDGMVVLCVCAWVNSVIMHMAFCLIYTSAVLIPLGLRFHLQILYFVMCVCVCVRKYNERHAPKKTHLPEQFSQTRGTKDEHPK